MTYTYLQAVARIELLKQHGIWPAIIGPDARGRFRLSYDPDPEMLAGVVMEG